MIEELEKIYLDLDILILKVKNIDLNVFFYTYLRLG